LDNLRDISESFVDVKNIPKYRQTLIDLHKHLKKSNQAIEKDGIKLDTGSRVLGSDEANRQSMSRILSTQTGSQIRDKTAQCGVFENDSPDRQIVQRNYVEETSYKKMHKAQEISDFECQSPTPKNLELKMDSKSSQSMCNPLIHFRSESTVKGPNPVLVSANKKTNKKTEKVKRSGKNSGFSSNKKSGKKSRYSNHASTNKKVTSRKSFSTHKKTVGGMKSKSRSPSGFKMKFKKISNLNINKSLWRNEKKPKVRKVRDIVNLMKQNDFSKMKFNNFTKTYDGRGKPNYTQSRLKKIN
jgi:hypothetical protein